MKITFKNHYMLINKYIKLETWKQSLPS